MFWEKAKAYGYLREAPEPYHVDPAWLAASHKRCDRAGLSRDIKSPRDVLRGQQRAEFLAENSRLLVKVRPLLTQLYREIPDQSCILIFTDRDGRTLDIISSPEMLDLCKKIGLSQGTSFREESCGTTAISWALHYGDTVVLRGEQHYCVMFHDWCCVASPIRDPEGNVTGCMDLSTRREADLGVTAALIRRVAGEITRVLSPSKEPSDKTPPCPISPRQREILALLAYGLTRKGIALRLHISVGTVGTQLKSLYQKLGGRNDNECIALAYQKGILPLEKDIT